MNSYIKSFCHIHSTHEDLRTIPQKVINCFEYSIGTHITRHPRLIGKLTKNILDSNFVDNFFFTEAFLIPLVALFLGAKY